MNKKLLLPVLGLTLTGVVTVGVVSHGVYATEPQVRTYIVDYFKNFQREEFTLSNGQKGKGNNLLYLSVEAKEYCLLEKPEDPVRERYEFQGWYLEEKCEHEWDFANDRMISGNLRLFAKWGVTQKEEGVEPEYTPPSTVLEESATTDYVINSVMNFKITNNQIKVSKAALLKLDANKDNVLPLMEYKVKASKTITATYASNNITVTCGNSTQTIQVKDDSLNLEVDNSTYESKAKNYENKALEEDSYHVMLAGSSSIEFWTSSKEDLDPVVSFNHGIGGTTIEQWDEKLNQRLVYPYKPKMVVYYVGINNVINSKEDATTIWNRLEKFFNDTHEALPDTKVQYILMNLIPNYKSYFGVINSVNANVIEYQKSNTWLTLINPGEALIKANGEPNAAYFRTDGLHLSYYGYEVWGEIIKQSIFEGLENK
ncbi:MAG: InlB B-repeat-containing protein [Bacilli bacterium]|nr:InlB B-repeat-containing protein [Bacilli bacterium]